VIPRIPVDLAIERWLRALERAEGCRSTSALLAAAQEYGCVLHGGGHIDGARMSGIVDADCIVRECTEDEICVLFLRYWCVVSEPDDVDATGQTVNTKTRQRGLGEIARCMRVTRDAAKELLTSAREKVRRALAPPMR